ncbi:MAG: hypothetical protein PHO37_02335 [Kiritimatiellae bacterium]|nr:hypothetical protein [Kiritimatiellia bacterium]
MKKMILMLMVAALGLTTFGNEIKHRFLISNFMGKSLHYVDQMDASKNWELKLEQIVMDMQLVGNNQLMVNHDKGYHLYDLNTRERTKNFRSDKMSAIRSMRRLQDGRTFFASERGPVYEFDAEENFVAEYKMPKVVTYVRMMRFTPQGNLLLSCNDGAFEVTLKQGLEPEERMVKKFLLPRPRNAYMALYAPDGASVYVSGGYSKGFYTFDTEGKLLKDIVVDQPEGLHNYFYGGFQMLRNGHIVMCNWSGHNKGDFKPGLKLVEFDKDFRVVWSWNEEFGGTVNQMLVLDDLDPAKLNQDTSGILQAL